MFVTVQNTAGGSLGPFDIYYDAVNPGLLLASNVSSASLAAGVDLTVSDAATSIIVVNTRNGCGSTQQIINLPPPVTPINFDSVTISARLDIDTTLPTTASVYYKIDNSSYFFLGNFDSSSCDTLTTVPVPTNSTIYLGIVSGSDSIQFAATGSNAICTGTALPTDYCGTSTPFSLRISGSQVISLGAKVVGGVIQTCATPPPPPPPPPPAPGNPTVVIKGSLVGDLNTKINLTVTRFRNRNATPIYQELNTNVLPANVFNLTSTPDVQPGDSIQVTIESAATPASQVAIRILGGPNSGNLTQIYRTAGFATIDSYTINIPATGASYYQIEASSV